MIIQQFWTKQLALLIRLINEDSVKPYPPLCTISVKLPNLIGMYLRTAYFYYLQYLPHPISYQELNFYTQEKQLIDPGIPVLVVWQILQAKNLRFQLNISIRPKLQKICPIKLFQHGLKQSFCTRFSYRGAQDLLMNLTVQDYQRMYFQSLQGNIQFLKGQKSLSLIASIKKNQKQPQKLPLKLHIQNLNRYRLFGLIIDQIPLQDHLKRLGYEMAGKISCILGKVPLNKLFKGACCIDGFVRVICKQSINRESKFQAIKQHMQIQQDVIINGQ